MEPVLEALRAALSEGATPDQRAAGANACRAMLAALEATPGQPLPMSPPSAAASTDAPAPTSAPSDAPTSTPSDAPTSAPTAPAAPPVALPLSLAGLSLDQILDLAIGRMRAMLPAEKVAAAPAQAPLIVRMFRG